MIAHFPRHRWYNRFAGLVVVIGLVWYYLAPVGSNTFALVIAGLFAIVLVIGLVLRRMEGPEEGAGNRREHGDQSRFTNSGTDRNVGGV